MLKSFKNLLKLNPWYIGLYLIVLILLILSSFLEYKSRYRDLLQLIQDQAAMTAAVIAQSGSGQAYLTEELKQSYIDRALDMLSILNRIDTQHPLSRSQFEQWINEETIMNIMSYDSDGNVDGFASKNVLKNTAQNQEWVQKELRPIYTKAQDMIIVGIDQPPEASTTDQFLVAIPRDRGGAITCQLNLEAEEDFKYLTAMETALEDLLNVNGLQYVKLALDDREPYYVSKSNERVDDSWNREALADILFKVSKGNASLLEVVRPVFFSSSLGEVRIGFNSEPLVSLKGQIIYQILIRTTLFTLVAFLLMIYLLLRRNATLLKEEKQRIEGEVYRLEKLNRLREKQAAMGELAAGVAHEIRNPLNAIGIVAQRLQREFKPDKDQKEYKSLTGTMVSEISRLNKSLQDFLEYTRPTPLNYSTLYLNDFLGSIQDLYKSAALKKGISLSVDANPISFEADAEYLRQVLSNLVRNALDVTESGGTIHLEGKQSGGILQIKVSDTGVGIPGDQLNQIFDLYYTTKDMGTGVGLALTHKIIADHHGTIEVSSEPGKGSVFSIELPVKA